MKENDFTWKWELRYDKTLVEAYQYIEKQLRDKKSDFPAVARASIMADQLRRNNWLTQGEIHRHIFMQFLERKKHKAFDSGKGSLYTYTGHHTHLEVRDLKRKHRSANKKEATFRYSVEDEYLNLVWNSDTLPKSVTEKNWRPLLRSQCPLLNGLTESDSPEDLLIKKEFWGLVFTIYDEIDVMVLIGKMRKTEAAAEKNMKYDAYCKSLQRKNEAFKIIATEAGHC